MREQLMVFAGSSNVPLADSICRGLGVSRSEVLLERFSNENLSVQILDSVRDADVFVVQSLYPRPSEALVELMLLCDALRGASAARVTAVIPHYSYARSDKKDKPRISIAARLMADTLITAGANRFLTMTLHSEQVQGFFTVPTDHLQAATVISEYLCQRDLSNTVAVMDMGQDKRVARYAKRLDLPVAIVSKRRVSDHEVRIEHVVGDLAGKDAIIFDDEISRGTTLVQTAAALQEHGVGSIRAACTHGLFAGPAIELIEASPLVEVIATDTVYLPPEKRIPKLTIISVAQLFARAIANVHAGSSMAQLFEGCVRRT
ncbi:MAG: ribose-phosphate diphosphokinase [Bacteroidota bacterium]